MSYNKEMDTTIVIPAYKPVDLLKKCVDSVLAYTDMKQVELTIVCNGSDEKSAEYVMSLSKTGVPICFYWYKNALGFTRASNIGMKIAQTKYIILMNTDVEILTFAPRHQWVERLINPMRENNKIAVTGVAEMTFYGQPFLPFFCVGLQKHVLEQFNYLDEAFSPGYGEDIDFCFKVVRNGYEIKLITKNELDHINKRCISDFPMFHRGRASFGIDGAALAARGEQIIYERYIK